MMQPDSITQQFLNALAAGPPGPKLHEMVPAEARAMAAGLRSAFPETYPTPSTDVDTRTISGGPNGDLTIHVVRPPGRSGPLPVVMFFHGGGWLLGDFHSHGRLVREIAVGVNAAVVFPEYSLSPEVRFPVANEEAFFVTNYVAENARVLNIDGSRIAVAGDSAGANMASVVCMLAKEHRGPKISGAALFFPVVGADFDTASYREFSEGYFLTRDSMKWFWNHYAPDIEARKQPHASLLHASDDQLRALPPTFLMTCEFDVLRDEGEALAHRLIGAGVPVAGARYLGTIHTCVTQGALASTPATRNIIAAANAHLLATLA